MFPSPKELLVIVIEVESLDRLQPLADALDRAVVSTGFVEADHPFRGHLTIARIKSKRRIQIELPEVSRHDDHDHLIKTPVEHVALIASTTTPEGSIYRELAQFKL